MFAFYNDYNEVMTHSLLWITINLYIKLNEVSFLILIGNNNLHFKKTREFLLYRPIPISFINSGINFLHFILLLCNLSTNKKHSCCHFQEQMFIVRVTCCCVTEQHYERYENCNVVLFCNADNICVDLSGNSEANQIVISTCLLFNTAPDVYGKNSFHCFNRNCNIDCRQYKTRRKNHRHYTCSIYKFVKKKSLLETRCK